MPYAQVNGIRLYYEEHGSGVPILCVHGAGSTVKLWEEAVQRLARLGRVIAYDRRGCGRSEAPEPYERTTVIEQADDAAALLEARATGPAVVVARSYGGWVATELALRDPGRVRALALLEPDAPGLSPAADAWAAAAADRMRGVAEREGPGVVGKALIDEVFGAGVWDSFSAELRRYYAGNGPAILAELRYEGPRPDAARLATLDRPVLLVAAAESPPEFREATEALARALPGARLALVGGGHLIDPASPEVLAFIEEVLARG